jgi:hypothetical protein
MSSLNVKPDANYSTLVSNVTEVLIAPSNARLIKIIPQSPATLTSTITIREGAVADASGTLRFTAPVGVTTNAPLEFGADGIAFNGGLTVKLSANESVLVIWGLLK